MRITSWNCLCGDVSRRLSDLAPLRSDLITLQECRRPASDSASVIWRGDIPYQGVAVVSTEATRRLEFVEIPKLHPTVVPVRVQAPQLFVFVGVWTHPDYNKVAWEAMTACVAAADGLPVVAAGDFNSSPSVQGQESASQRFLQRMRDELGLVSAYHLFFRRVPRRGDAGQLLPWEERSPTVPHRLLLCARGVGGSSHRGGGRQLRRLAPERSPTAHRGHRRRVAVRLMFKALVPGNEHIFFTHCCWLRLFRLTLD